ncbi:hypothetical protein GCM10010517_80770 [Streptosporangium fragile]|uniref:Uncharacterized protein n=1 Tax=Streptosporangium fragile TaxID=46186 RepID=A0ABN3WGX0_9ACTN
MSVPRPLRTASGVPVHKPQENRERAVGQGAMQLWQGGVMHWVGDGPEARKSIDTSL